MVLFALATYLDSNFFNGLGASILVLLVLFFATPLLGIVLVFLLIKCGKGVSKSDHGLGPVLNRVAGLIVIVLSIMLSTWAIKTSNGLAIPFSYLLIVTGVVPGLLGGWLGILLILK